MSIRDELIVKQSQQIQELKDEYDELRLIKRFLNDQNKLHVEKFNELLNIIERYNKSTGETGCGNHVYNEIIEHLSKTG